MLALKQLILTETTLVLVLFYLHNCLATPASSIDQLKTLPEGTFLTADDFERAGKINFLEPQKKNVSSTCRTKPAFRDKIRNAVWEMHRLWLSYEVPYIISERFTKDQRAQIAKSILSFHNRTCVRFVPLQYQSDYVFIRLNPDGGCYSDTTGRINGVFKINLGTECFYPNSSPGLVTHELMHSIGFDHEHQRYDRDDYVTINWQNVLPSYIYAFHKLEDRQLFDATYDYKSLMHYHTYAFSHANKPTIVPKFVTAREMGQMIGFSDLDVWKINRLYQCDGIYRPSDLPPDPIASCRDNLPNCDELKSTGHCVDYPDWARFHCRRTCALCPDDDNKDDDTLDSDESESSSSNSSSRPNELPLPPLPPLSERPQQINGQVFELNQILPPKQDNDAIKQPNYPAVVVPQHGNNVVLHPWQQKTPSLHLNGWNTLQQKVPLMAEAATIPQALPLSLTKPRNSTDVRIPQGSFNSKLPANNDTAFVMLHSNVQRPQSFANQWQTLSSGNAHGTRPTSSTAKSASKKVTKACADVTMTTQSPSLPKQKVKENMFDKQQKADANSNAQAKNNIISGNQNHDCPPALLFDDLTKPRSNQSAVVNNSIDRNNPSIRNDSKASSSNVTTVNGKNVNSATSSSFSSAIFATKFALSAAVTAPTPSLDKMSRLSRLCSGARRHAICETVAIILTKVQTQLTRMKARHPRMLR